jgi:hypothetical protein
VDDHQRGVRRDGVQPAQRGFGQAGQSSRVASLLPSTLQQRVPADEVRAGGAACGDLLPDRVDDHLGVADGDGPDVDHAVGQHDGLHQRMSVRLDQPGHDAAVAEFDGLGVGPDPPGDIGPIADRDDPPVGHRQRPGGGTGLVHGQHGSENDQVSRHERIDSESRGKILQKTFPARVDFGGLPFDVSNEGHLNKNGRAPSTNQKETEQWRVTC